jgi:hypothetical protein
MQGERAPYPKDTRQASEKRKKEGCGSFTLIERVTPDRAGARPYHIAAASHTAACSIPFPEFNHAK